MSFKAVIVSFQPALGRSVGARVATCAANVFAGTFPRSSYSCGCHGGFMLMVHEQFNSIVGMLFNLMLLKVCYTACSLTVTSAAGLSWACNLGRLCACWLGKMLQSPVTPSSALSDPKTRRDAPLASPLVCGPHVFEALGGGSFSWT